jgi:hypothetical protein
LGECGRESNAVFYTKANTAVRANASKLLKPVENQHADLEQEATEATEIFLLCSPISVTMQQGAKISTPSRQGAKTQREALST